MSESKVRPPLRAALEEIVRCPPEDFGLVWQSLSSDERARLRPLLLQTVCDANLKSPFMNLLTDGYEEVARKQSDTDAKAGRIAMMVEQLPDALAARLLASADAALRPAILALLSAQHRSRAMQAGCASAATSHASAAWLDICLEHVDGLHETQHSRSSRRVVKRGALASILHRLRACTGGRR
jgi:hypothetical protein